MKQGMLWIFGDSYGQLPGKGDYEKLKDQLWIPMLTEKLNHCNFYNICHNGAANEWSYYNFVNNLHQIDADHDTIIFIVTQIHRQWFFYDNIGVSNHYMNGIEEYVDKDQAKAIRYYQEYLSNNPQDLIRGQWLLYALEMIKLKKECNLIVLPGFRENQLDYGNSKGSLFDVCINEVKGKTLKSWSDWLTAKPREGSDPRIGHLSLKNHTILANKLYNCIKKGENLDLTSGFYEEIL